MKDEIFEMMYQEVHGGIYSTLEYEKAEETFCTSQTNEEFEKKFDLLMSAVSSECRLAFRSGFYAAVSILIGGAK